MSWSGGTVDLAPEVRAAYDSLPWPERKLSGWLILRVLNRNPRRARELERYGPRAVVDLARIRAIHAWLFVLAAPVVALSVIFGPPDAFWVLVVVVVAIAGVGLFALRISNEGKRWRAKRQID